MCQHVPGSSVKLHIWNQCPYITGASSIEFRGGHISLEIQQGNVREYLGWWPGWWTVKRVKGQSVPKTSSRGRLSLYSKQSVPPITTNPDEIDSVLVANPELGNPARIGPWAEQLPDDVYDLCVVRMNMNNLLNYVRQFQADVNANRTEYRWAWNNCATVCAAALKASGVIGRISPWSWTPVWSPWLLEKLGRRLKCV